MVAVLASGLAGCDGWNRVAETTQFSRGPNQPAGLLDTVDGNYKGFATPAVNQAPPCPGDVFGRLEIGDQKLYFAYKPDTLFVAPIRPDGGLYAVSGPSVLEGTLSNGRLAFTVRTPVCASRYDMNWTL